MCRAKSEGGRRCRCDGTNPLPRNRDERQVALAERAATAAARRTRKADDQRRHRERTRAVPPSPPGKESKALFAARRRLEMARAAGASQEVIDLLTSRVDAAKPKPKPRAAAPRAEGKPKTAPPSPSPSPSATAPAPAPSPSSSAPSPSVPSSSAPENPFTAIALAGASSAPSPSVPPSPSSENPFIAVAVAHQARVSATAVLQSQGQSQLLPFEPEHVLVVAHGEGARWTPIDDGEWAITARGDEVRPDRTVVVTRRDGSRSVERIGSVITSGLVDGQWVGVVRPAPRG